MLIVTLCKEAGDWKLLNENVQLLAKKHSQLKQAITKMVQKVMEFLDDTPDVDTKLSVIEALRNVTEGKVRPEEPLPFMCAGKLGCCIDVYCYAARSSSKSNVPG